MLKGIEFDNLPEIERKLDADLVDEPIEGMYDTIGGGLVRTLGQTVRDTTETHTGRLAGDWVYNPNDFQVETPVPYARFVDAGTTHIVRPRRFVQKAIKQASGDAQKAAEQAARAIEATWRT